ncbi:hypothetical protein GH714_026799 [Hevea brasiliensis]|uniref:NHL repeat-containing protein n=1 Tax=Hevea brasiliensis TaxID=3981 RepID=A0A6A6NJD1_HEVBR|nr:hypothetical protein GH714_026799 [Hevea brasiliensis]
MDPNSIVEDPNSGSYSRRWLQVTTVIDGNKLKINPCMVLPRPGLSDLVVLDSFQSVFYTVSFPISQGSVFKRYSGDGVAGFLDGAPGSARFNKPKSFAVDLKGNIYVADRRNGAIRKISDSGVTTIAGGQSERIGHEDGPAQNATFSNDFEVSFVPEHWEGFLLGSCCWSGLIMFTGVRHREGFSPLHRCKTWKLCLINPVKQVWMLCFDIRSVVASSRLYELLRRFIWLSLSHLSLLFGINTLGLHASRKGTSSQTSSKGFVSLLDSDVNSFEMEKSQLLPDELKDLVSVNGPLQLSNSKNEDLKQEDQDDVLLDGHGRIDAMIKANIIGFAKVAKETSLNGSLVGSQCLVKRR